MADEIINTGIDAGRKTIMIELVHRQAPAPVQVELPAGRTALEVLDLLLASDTGAHRSPILAVKINNVIKSLYSRLSPGDRVELVDLETEDGLRIYTRSLVLVLARAARDVLPGCSVKVEHSLGNGIYGEFRYERPVKGDDVARIEARMREIVAADEPIVRHRLKKEEAAAKLRESGRLDTADLVERYITTSTVQIHTCGSFTDYAYGVLAPRTGLLNLFKLRYYLPGFIMELPRPEDPTTIPPYVEQGKLANIYYEAERWGRILGVRTVSDLNDVIISGEIGDLIRVAEAFHEKKLAQIADLIASNIDRIRIVLIAGPSSSGKTTFAHRLGIQLRVNGILPVPISMDNYFVEREKTPLDEEGRPDFDSPAAVDQELLNDHLTKLIQGEEVELPTFDFLTGKRVYRGDRVKLSPRHLVVVEGIHGLNDTLTASVPAGRKFKIYVSALTQLSLDDLNRISTTDVRIIRRIVRDNQFRGRSAVDTIKAWPVVRRGERRNIFPFQEATDIMFNSALVYELAVLKRLAEPLLEQVPPDVPEATEARRLLKFLSYFLPYEDDQIPATSIIREFIGGGCFPT